MAFWLERTQATRRLLTHEHIAELNDRARLLDGGPRVLWTHDWVPKEGSLEAIAARAEAMKQELAAGRWTEAEPGALGQAETVMLHSVEVDHVRLVLRETPLRCLPLSSAIYRRPADPAFDRNACSSLHPGEAVRVLRRAAGGEWLYVRTPYAVGWVQPAGLGPPLTEAQWQRWRSEPTLIPADDTLRSQEGFPLRLGVGFPIVDVRDETIEFLVPGDSGLESATVSASEPSSRLPFTRENVFSVAFSLLGRPYGWGGAGGNRDCSRFLRDVFFVFGLQLARHSGVQAHQGTLSLDVTGWDEHRKLEMIRSAAEHGVVLLYMPGHIMLYLGEDGGHDYAISALSEWLEPCPGGSDTVYRIDRVAVSTLELGRGTERTAFSERITRIIVFGDVSQGGHVQEPERVVQGQ